MEYALKTSRSARRGAVGLPRQGGEGRRGEMWGVARPGWLSALPSLPDGGEEEEDEDEAGRMADRRGAALLLVDRRRGVAMWCR